jgi:threonine dehydrogenase-like Zn-dependent dehydrogenase
MDVNQARLAFCRSHLGVTRTLQPAGPDTPAHVGDALGGLPLVVFDATGNRESMEASFTLPAHGGTLAFVGLVQADVTFRDPDFHRRELTLLASRNALPGDFAHVLAILESGRLDVRPWITHRAALDDVPEHFPRWLSPEAGVVKAIIEV